jgi:hypothetical protein
MKRIKAGQPVIDLVTLCYRANRPVMLCGSHGIGKSELLERAAAELGIGYICRDLSLMEPPDLLGLPQVQGGTTIYSPPNFLPVEGKGLLVFEELNRCERYMRAPCLQLLTARTLNDYRLPAGWLPVAAINPFESDANYEVSELDPALTSRFVQVSIEPDVSEWLGWAEQNRIHPDVVLYAQTDTTIFDSPQSNPRAWEYVSNLLLASESNPPPAGTLEAAVAGVVGEVRCETFMRQRAKREAAIDAKGIFGRYSKHRPGITQAIKNGRLDLVRATIRSLQTYLQVESDFRLIRQNRRYWANLRKFCGDLPGDLRESFKTFFSERQYDFPHVTE